jgi:hypothetical protein
MALPALLLNFGEQQMTEETKKLKIPSVVYIVAAFAVLFALSILGPAIAPVWPSVSVTVALDALLYSILWVASRKVVAIGTARGTSRMASLTSMLKMAVRDSTLAPLYQYRPLWVGYWGNNISHFRDQLRTSVSAVWGAHPAYPHLGIS